MKFYLGFASALVVLFGLMACGSKNQDSKSADENAVVDTETVNDAESGIQVIDFYATWCVPCKHLAPIIEKMEKKYAGKVTFSRVDVDANPQLAEQYNITAMPTLVYIIDGEVVDVTVGLMAEEELDAKLSGLIK